MQVYNLRLNPPCSDLDPRKTEVEWNLHTIVCHTQLEDTRHQQHLQKGAVIVYVIKNQGQFLMEVQA